MKISRYIHILLASTVGLSLVSCEDEDENGPVPDYMNAPAAVELNTSTVDTITALESVGTISIPVDLVSQPLSNDVTVNYTLSGALSSTGSVVIPAGAKSVDLDVPIPNDKVVEDTEYVTVTLTSTDNSLQLGRNGRGIRKIIEISDDLQELGFTSDALTVMEQPGENIMIIPIMFSNNLQTEVEVAYTVTPVAGNSASNIEVLSPNPLIIKPAMEGKPGVKGDTIRVRVLDNLNRDLGNTYEVNLISVTPVSADEEIMLDVESSMLELTIQDDVRTVAFVQDTDTVEVSTPGVLNYEVVLDQPSTQPVTISYTISGATAGTDYVDNTGGTIRIPAGATVGNVNVTLLEPAFGQEPVTKMKIMLNSVTSNDKEVVIGGNNTVNLKLE